MTLDKLEREGLIKKLPKEYRKVKDALSLAQRDIITAKNILTQDTDWAFTIAYNAILQAFRAFMFSKGYRPNGSNQHISVVRFAELYFEKDVVIVFDRMRQGLPSLKNPKAPWASLPSTTRTKIVNPGRSLAELPRSLSTRPFINSTPGSWAD